MEYRGEPFDVYLARGERDDQPLLPGLPPSTGVFEADRAKTQIKDFVEKMADLLATLQFDGRYTPPRRRRKDPLPPPGR